MKMKAEFEISEQISKLFSDSIFFSPQDSGCLVTIWKELGPTAREDTNKQHMSSLDSSKVIFQLANKKRRKMSLGS